MSLELHTCIIACTVGIAFLNTLGPRDVQITEKFGLLIQALISIAMPPRDLQSSV